ncbi:aldo/keto reductase [Polynucleobacter paneuropaeus]|nr:aldo/keto reductase [Polynucleobacter paneuropaeus]
MKQIILPGTNLKLSRLIFGTASLFNVGSKIQRINILEEAINQGFTHFDTAPYYGFGLAEKDLSEVLARHPTMTVSSKVGIYSPGSHDQSAWKVLLRKAGGKILPALSKPTIDFSIARAKDSLEKSLKRLGREKIDLFLLHDPSVDLINAEEWHAWLSSEVQSGKVGAFGLALDLPRLDSFLKSSSPLTPVIQLADSVDLKESALLDSYNRVPQITYGYLYGAIKRGLALTRDEIIRQALAINHCGSIIVSTTKLKRIQEFTQMVKRHDS